MFYVEDQTITPAAIIADKLIHDRMFEAHFEWTILDSLPLHARRELEASLDGHDDNPNAPASRLAAIVKKHFQKCATQVGGALLDDAEEIVLDCAEAACVEIMGVVSAEA